MIRMAAIAPKGVFEDEEYAIPPYEDAPRERHFDDYTRNCDE